MIRIPIQKLIIVFWLIVLIDITALYFGFQWLHVFAKPLLMPALVQLVYSGNFTAPGRKLILTGLFFSWLGDVFLLFESHHSLFFIFGLASFFVTHICYIGYFLSIRSGEPSLLQKQPMYIILTLCFGAGLVWLLYPYLGELKIPVVLYAAIICSMLLCSIHIYLKVKVPANQYFIAGAVLFVLSDSLLAINKFYQPLPLAGISVMLTYCTAQYFIVRGLMGMGSVKSVLRLESN
jgi:uncharacterized membrane protein YhhN